MRGQCASRLVRSDEAPAVVYKTEPPALPAEEEEALARRLVQPEADRVLARGDQQEKTILLYGLAVIDPADALERLEAADLADRDTATAIRIAAAEALAAQNPDEGLAVVEALKTADDRALGYFSLIRARPDLEPTRTLQVVDQAILNARSVGRANLKLYLLAQISDRLIELGEIERAKRLIREGEELARKTLRDKALSRELGLFAGVMLCTTRGMRCRPSRS